MDRIPRRRIGAVGCIAGLLAFAALAAPATAAGLVGARSAARVYSGGPAATAATIERSAASARLVFEMNLPVAVKAFVLAEPDRVIVDLPEIGFLLNPSAGRLPAPARNEAQPLVSAFRFGQFAIGRSRIVIDLAGPARIARADVEPTPSGAPPAL